MVANYVYAFSIRILIHMVFNWIIVNIILNLSRRSITRRIIKTKHRLLLWTDFINAAHDQRGIFSHQTIMLALFFRVKLYVSNVSRCWAVDVWSLRAAAVKLPSWRNYITFLCWSRRRRKGLSIRYRTLAECQLCMEQLSRCRAMLTIICTNRFRVEQWKRYRLNSSLHSSPIFAFYRRVRRLAYSKRNISSAQFDWIF